MIIIRRHFLNAPKRTHLPMLSGPLSKGLMLLLLEEEEAEQCSSRLQKTPEKGRAGEAGDAL